MGFGLLSGVSAANAATGDLTVASATTAGLLSPTGDITGKGVAAKATLLNTGTLSLNVATDAGAGDGSKVVVSAGGYIASSANETVSADQLSGTTIDGAGTSGRIDVKTTGAVGSTFTITSYSGLTTSSSVTMVITVTIASSSTQGTVSASKSLAVWSMHNSSVNLPSTAVDSASASETTTGLSVYLHLKLRDAYGNSITATDGALVVTASTGAVVGISAYQGSATASTYSTAVSNANPSDLSVIVSEGTAGSGWSGTVSVTYNGTLIATKTGKITGNVAKLEVEVVKIGKNNGSASADAFRYKATDSVGNALALAAASVVYSSSSNTAVISTAVGTTASTSDTRGYGSYTCATSATGSVDLVLKTVLTNGTTISSNTVKALCGGSADTYTASLDKAKYAQGDVATMKVTFKDSKGALANSYDSVTNLAAANASISTPMMKQIGAISQADVTDVNGQVIYKFNVGDVSSFAAGKYNSVVSFGTPANGAAQTVAYEVSGAGGVSNSDILASIVKLITAINKQIAALQKLLLKK
jgi:hypothetical protein